MNSISRKIINFQFSGHYFIDWKKHRKASHHDLRMRSILLFSCHQLLPKTYCKYFDSWRYGLQKCGCDQGFTILSNWKNRSHSICTCCAAHFATWASVYHQGTYTVGKNYQKCLIWIFAPKLIPILLNSLIWILAQKCSNFEF